jgi:hypothetical protein
MLNDFTNRGLGSTECDRPESRCIPHYRTRYMYIHRMATKGWLRKGVVCNNLVGDGLESGQRFTDLDCLTSRPLPLRPPLIHIADRRTEQLSSSRRARVLSASACVHIGTMLLKAGVVESFDEEAAAEFGNAPCLIIPTLKVPICNVARGKSFTAASR